MCGGPQALHKSSINALNFLVITTTAISQQGMSHACRCIHKEHPHQYAAFKACRCTWAVYHHQKNDSLIIAQSTDPHNHTQPTHGGAEAHRQQLTSQAKSAGQDTTHHRTTQPHPHAPSLQHCYCAALHLLDTHRCSILAGRTGGRKCMDRRQLSRGRNWEAGVRRRHTWLNQLSPKQCPL
jgi:hypothetical protein